jgi:hypothetical protein
MAQQLRKSIIHTFNSMLVEKNVVNLLSCCSEDVILSWAHFTFKGRKEIKRWAKELYQMFPILEIHEESLLIGRNVARQVFMLTVTTQSNRKGKLPVVATYRFRDNEIVHFHFAISIGLVFITDEKSEP